MSPLLLYRKKVSDTTGPSYHIAEIWLYAFTISKSLVKVQY